MSSSNWKDYFQQGGIFEDNPVKSPIAGVRSQPTFLPPRLTHPLTGQQGLRHVRLRARLPSPRL